MNLEIENQSLPYTGRKLLRGEQAAQILNCSKAYVFLLIRQGHLPGVRLGRSVRIRREDLDAFIAAGGTQVNGSQRR